LCGGVGVLWAALGWLCASGSAQTATPRTVLTIFQGPESFPSNPVYDLAIRQAIFANVSGPIDYFAEYLDPDPATFDQESDALAAYIRTKYSGRRIDVVITVADEAVRFALTHRDDLFPGAPIVYVGLYQPDETVRATSGGLTGVRPGVAYGRTLEAALALHPGTERVYVIANAESPGTSVMARTELNRFANRVTLTYLDAPTVAELLNAVRSIPQRSLVLYLWNPGHELGNLVYSDAIASMLAQASPVPVYGTSDFYIGTGVVGGVIRRTSETGTRMGQLAARILNGARAQDLPIEASPLVPVFDWRQLQRWNIAPSVLPAGSILQFRTPTIWESYRSYIIIAAVVMCGELALIAGLLTQRTRRRGAEAIVRAREATLRKTYEQTRHLAGRLLNAQEATRAAIARDLHDGLCQDLASVTAAVTGLKDSSGAITDPATQQAISEIEKETLDVYDQIRRLSHDLHPPTLRLLGLPPALKAHCAEVQKRHGVQVEFSTDGSVGRLDPDMEISFFRIAQEALRNSLVHGHAQHLAVSLARSNGHIELTVQDDGRGFDVEAARHSARGLGLMSMDERAHVFGGDVQVESGSQRGTTIRVRGSAGSAAASV
jgi:signal transduction histidine kinase